MGTYKVSHDGTLYSFSCLNGAFLVGSASVICDGQHWIGEKPECHLAPRAPSLSIIVDGIERDSPDVAPGQEVTLVCNSLGGSPEPSLQLQINHKKVGKEANEFVIFNFIAEKNHDGARISCTARNKVVPYPVPSLFQVLSIQCKL